MNGLLTVSFLLVGIQCASGAVLPLTVQQQQQAAAQASRDDPSAAAPLPPQFQSDLDYSRFYFGNNNLGYYDKKSVPVVGPPSQWYAGTLPRQLAPKFKRDLNSYGPHDKRLDEQLFDDYYLNMKPNRYEWNFNRL